MMSCVIGTLRTVPFLQIWKLRIRETASSLRESTEKSTQNECLLNKPRSHARTVDKHGIIQNEFFSKSDSNRDSIEIVQNSIQSDYYGSVPWLITSDTNLRIL